MKIGREQSSVAPNPQSKKLMWKRIKFPFEPIQVCGKEYSWYDWAISRSEDDQGNMDDFPCCIASGCIQQSAGGNYIQPRGGPILQ